MDKKRTDIFDNIEETKKEVDKQNAIIDEIFDQFAINPKDKQNSKSIFIISLFYMTDLSIIYILYLLISFAVQVKILLAGFWDRQVTIRGFSYANSF